jgi:hypothetical protein
LGTFGHISYLTLAFHIRALSDTATKPTFESQASPRLLSFHSLMRAIQPQSLDSTARGLYLALLGYPNKMGTLAPHFSILFQPPTHDF